MRFGAGLWLLLLWLPATAVELPELMAALAQAGARDAVFSETRESRFTRKPLESSGRLSFQPPDILIRRVEQPRFMIFAVHGQQVSIEKSGRRQQHDLAELGAARGFVESLRATLAGDLTALEKYYRLQFQTGVENWSLDLYPREPELAKKIQLIRISGRLSPVRVERVKVRERNGAVTITTLEPVDAQD